MFKVTNFFTARFYRNVFEIVKLFHKPVEFAESKTHHIASAL